MTIDEARQARSVTLSLVTIRIGEAGGVRRCQARSGVGMARLERSFAWTIKLKRCRL